MKKIATYLALFIVFFGNIVAQNLEGIVLDAETSEPVYNALVYLDGTSFITATNTEGKFKLSVGNRINTRLVISHVSYERIIISEPFDALPEVIYLEKQVIQLDEVTVSAVSQSRYTRNQMLKAFRQQFLGKTKAGKACKILNEDDIRLKYDTVDQILYASSNVPVRIENKRLGYKLLWEIIEFKILYKKDLREDYPIISNTGTVIFEDLAPDNRRIAMNRREAYENSPRQFFKLIAGEKLHEHDYSLYKNDRQYPADKLFIVKDNPSGNTVKTVTVKRDAEDKGEIIVDIRKFSKIGKTFTMKVASQIIFYSDTLSVDISGYEVKPMGSVLITGEMGMYRTGDILPLNYETEKIAEQKSKPDMEEKIYEQIKVFPQEKIHIHTDRSVYVSGEKIWYRIFLLDAISHIPVYGSRYVYVELISPTGELVSRDKIRRDSDSLFHNNIDLTEDLTEGAYLIRAYTNFMRNRPDYFFERKVFIASPEILKTGIENKGTERKKNIPAPQSSYDFDVSFFPEGGYFIPGEVCKTGFKALKTNGLSEDITGIIINDKGDTIVNIRSEHAGMGQFAFLPKHGVKYYAVCSNVPGNEKRFQLPDSNPEACALKVFAHKDNIYITVLKGKNFKEKQLKLVIHTRGFVVYAGELPEQNTLVIEKELILSGVSQVLLLDDKMNPLSERMFFYMDDKELAKTNFSTDKSAYTAGEHISARIQVIDNEENPLDGSFSVAVTDDGDVRADSLFSIVSGLLLCSEIRGYVESPEYYINNPNSADILMLTQAWRRYDIPAILKDSLEKPSYFPETSQQISGHVERVMGKKVNADNTVSL
ncbi:MAG: carboxypeptidase-like regulatory domain-containing protein, partial [Prevotellaceae bacterium]|nr:carboxypeptidase-like regulatory domain-containing protein [Prevotellaceae bacterium]